MLSLSVVGLLWAQPLNGTYTIGSSGNYLNLTAAMTDLDSRGINGAVRFEILPDYTGEPAGTATINVAKFGPYPGMGAYPVTITVHSSVSSPITIATSPNTGLLSRFVLRLTGVDNFIIDGGPDRLLRFQVNSPASGVGVIGLISDNTYHPNPCRNIVIRNVEIDGGDKSQTRVGIYLGQQGSFPGAALVAGNNNITIEDCWIYSVQEGILLLGNTSTRDQNNKILGCKIGHPVLAASWGGNSRSSGILVQNQENLDILRDTIYNASSSSSYGYTGIAVGYASQSAIGSGPCRNVRLGYNWIYNISYTGSGGWNAFGIRVNIGSLTNSGIYVYNNFIAGIACDGYSVPAGSYNAYGLFLDGSSNSNAGVYVYHNSIHLYGSVSSSFTNSNPSCIAISSDITGGVRIRNNIFQNTQTPGAASTTRTTIAIAYEGSSPSVFTELDNNAYYVANSNGSQYAYIGALGSTRYQTLANWQTAVGGGREQNSLALGTPGAPFTGNNDLHIPHGTTTPIEGGGVLVTSPFAITDDVDGEIRPQGSPNPDIGADEFVQTIPPCPSTIDADQISATPASLDVGTGSITLSVNTPANVTSPALWQLSINGGPWSTIAPYQGSPFVYTPTQAGTHDFRLVALVAPYHQSCNPPLQNDTSNVATVSVTCPTLSVDNISVSPTSIRLTQTVTVTVANPSNVTQPAVWQVSTDGGATWSDVANYTGSPFVYTPTATGNYLIRLQARPAPGCSGTPVNSNQESFTVLPPPGDGLNDPIDLTPQNPTRHDTTFTGSTNGYSSGTNRPPMGSFDNGKPAVYHRYVIRSCLDSLLIDMCASSSTDPDVYVHHVQTGCGYRQDYCSGCNYRPKILLKNDAAALSCNAGSSLGSSSCSASMRLSAGDTLIIVVQPFVTYSAVDYTLSIIEYPYDPSSAPTLPQPPFFSIDTSRVCLAGLLVRDSLNTQINTPGINHQWYINGVLQAGVTGPIFLPQFNSPGIYTVKVELTSVQGSNCMPPSSIPSDSVVIVVDSLPGTNVLVNGSEYQNGDFASISAQGSNVCVSYAPSLVESAYSYTWTIGGNTYSGPGPHQECYATSRIDTVVLAVTNGSCQEVDTVYVIVDLTSGLANARGDLRVYPVPAQEAVHIVWPASGSAAIRLESLQGQVVYEGRAEVVAGAVYRLNRGGIASGLYLLRVQLEGRSYLGRIQFE